MKHLAVAAALIAAALGPAQAGEVTLALGYDDALNRVGDGGPALGLDLRSEPLLRYGPLDLGLGAALEADTRGDVWAGGGGYVRHEFNRTVRVEASFMAGAYAVGSGTDLGSDLEFRSRIGISRAISDTSRLGLAIEHKSNAGLAKDNPGIETVFATLTRSF